jgi:hypothetical protein
MSTEKTCACGCQASMKYKRSDALYFSNACRTRAHRAKALRTAEIERKPSQNRNATIADAFWTGYRAIRRPDLRARWPR